MNIEKHPYYEYGTFTIQLGFEEIIFLEKEDGPKIEYSKGHYEIDTKTHEIKIDIKTGEILVRKRGWPDFYPVDDSIFGVTDNPPHAAEKKTK